MFTFPISKDNTTQQSRVSKESIQRIRKEIRQQRVVTFILFVIFMFQLASLPGAIQMQNMLSIGTVILGIALCGVAMIFNQRGNVGVVSLLLILVVDLGCGLMLLTPGMTMESMGSMSSSSGMSSSNMPSSNGMSSSSMPSSNGMSSSGNMSSMGNMSGSQNIAKLDVSELPTFDLLVISELIAVSLLPAVSIFAVAASNILFIIGMVVLMPHTAELDMLLKSSMSYNALAQPICLQLVVAAIAYMWVISALTAAARADRAEEIAELQASKALLQQREIEQKHQIENGVQELLQGLSRGINGQETVINLKQDHVLWKVGNAVSLLLTRVRRTRQIEQENRQLRAQLMQMRENLLVAKVMNLHKTPSGMNEQKNSPSSPNL